MWNKIKSYFTSKQIAEVDYEGAEENHGHYAVKRSRKIDLLLKIGAFLAAFGLWFYVVSTTATIEERSFELIPVVCKNDASLRAELGLIVQSISIDTLNVTLAGNRQAVRDLTSNQVKAYVNLSEIKSAGEHTLQIYFDLPSGITVASQNVTQVLVNVDSPSTRELKLSADQLQLRGWSLGDGCFFGEKKLSLSTLTLEGPTLALNKVAGVELRSDIIGSAQSSFTVTATPYLLDADGNPITDESITIREKAAIEAHVEVLKSKKVPLIVNSRHGEFAPGILSVSPSTVTITGDPQAVDSQKYILLGEVDERTLLADSESEYAVKANGLTVTDGQGNAVTKAKVKIKVSALPTRVIEAVNVWRGEKIVGTVKVTVRATAEEHAAQLQALLAENIAIYADPTKPEGDVSAMTVVFTEFFRDAVYEIALTDYKIKIAEPQGSATPELDHPSDSGETEELSDLTAETPVISTEIKEN